jgi:hypothetical protein
MSTKQTSGTEAATRSTFGPFDLFANQSLRDLGGDVRDGVACDLGGKLIGDAACDLLYEIVE